MGSGTIRQGEAARRRPGVDKERAGKHRERADDQRQPGRLARQARRALPPPADRRGRGNTS